MKKKFVPLFMRYPKVPPRPNQKVINDNSSLIKEHSLSYKDYPEDEVTGYEKKYYHPDDEVNEYEHQHYHHPTEDCSDDDKDCMYKPGQDMMPVCPLAKAFVCWQTYGNVYSPPEAFRKGTIFPELRQEY